MLNSAETNISHNSEDFIVVSYLMLKSNYSKLFYLKYIPIYFGWYEETNINNTNLAGDNKTHWFEACNISRNGYCHRITVAILCLLEWLDVLPPLKQCLPPIFLSLSPLKPHVIENGLCWNNHYDHHLLFSSNLLHIRMWPSLAICLPWWYHGNGHVHCCYNAFSFTFK